MSNNFYFEGLVTSTYDTQTKIQKLAVKCVLNGIEVTTDIDIETTKIEEIGYKKAYAEAVEQLHKKLVNKISYKVAYELLKPFSHKD